MAWDNIRFTMYLEGGYTLHSTFKFNWSAITDCGNNWGFTATIIAVTSFNINDKALYWVEFGGTFITCLWYQLKFNSHEQISIEDKELLQWHMLKDLTNNIKYIILFHVG